MSKKMRNSRYVTRPFGICPDCGREFRLILNRFGDWVIPRHYVVGSWHSKYLCPGSFGFCAADEAGLGVLGGPNEVLPG